ncbi:PREDICTED: ret finger protein-like 4B [Galeopterus variegatus]|uniref:Ret finger protein-like 4B n=1 Tax=Galeopterus variegatus TaxID=482537 RepID=A0ABM0QYZ3_GALVR|nr:PREDICTED: ret finger protein-like 4B [Galeopterus variegatus]
MARCLQAEATCPVCLDFFSYPVSISCGHTFCSCCIKKWMRERKNLRMICPMCREELEDSHFDEFHLRNLKLLIQQHFPLLEQSLHVSQKLLRFREDVTLDAATANSLLVLSDDLRSVRCGKVCHSPLDDPRRFTHLACVLGTPSFSAGCHYWEVEVGEGKEWALGVCRESVDRETKSNLSPEQGFWLISMRAGAIHANSIPEQRIPASSGLRRVAVFLDVELEEIKFFDVGNDALICIHSSLSVVEPLRPFFCPELPGEGDFGAPLSICP